MNWLFSFLPFSGINWWQRFRAPSTAMKPLQYKGFYSITQKQEGKRLWFWTLWRCGRQALALLLGPARPKVLTSTTLGSKAENVGALVSFPDFCKRYFLFVWLWLQFQQYFTYKIKKSDSFKISLSPPFSPQGQSGFPPGLPVSTNFFQTIPTNKQKQQKQTKQQISTNKTKMQITTNTYNTKYPLFKMVKFFHFLFFRVFRFQTSESSKESTKHNPWVLINNFKQHVVDSL